MPTWSGSRADKIFGDQVGQCTIDFTAEINDTSLITQFDQGLKNSLHILARQYPEISKEACMGLAILASQVLISRIKNEVVELGDLLTPICKWLSEHYRFRVPIWGKTFPAAKPAHHKEMLMILAKNKNYNWLDKLLVKLQS